jgi:hypothetical protein
MPTVLHVNGFRFFFFSDERNEPPHIHVERAECVAKFWLDRVTLAYNRGYNGPTLNRIRILVLEHRQLLLEAWNERFTHQS